MYDVLMLLMLNWLSYMCMGMIKKLVDKIWRIRYWYYENIWLYYVLFNYIWYLIIYIRLISVYS